MPNPTYTACVGMLVTMMVLHPVLCLLLYFMPLDDLECDIDNGGCNQICINTIGSFHCNCAEGYLLNDNGFSCDGEKAFSVVVYIILAYLSLLQILMNVYPVHVILMQLVTILMVALCVHVSMVILEMAFSAMVGGSCRIFN